MGRGPSRGGTSCRQLVTRRTNQNSQLARPGAGLFCAPFDQTRWRLFFMSRTSCKMQSANYEVQNEVPQSFCTSYFALCILQLVRDMKNNRQRV